MKIKKQIVIKNLAQSEWSDMCLVELSRAGYAEGRVVDAYVNENGDADFFGCVAYVGLTCEIVEGL